jgi:hypothetical protein
LIYLCPAWLYAPLFRLEFGTIPPLMGGTGKYKGVTGTVPYTVVQLHDTVGGRTAYIVNHKATRLWMT